MTGKQPDLRVKKTQRALSTALLTLLETQPLSRITVGDICMEAMVSRSAFYVHFEDKYALLCFCLELLGKDVFASSRKAGTRDRIRHVLENIQVRAHVFRNILTAESHHELLRMMRSCFHKDFTHLLAHPDKTAPFSGPPELVATYYASGAASVILSWLQSKKRYSVDEIADCLYALLPQDICACPR